MASSIHTEEKKRVPVSRSQVRPATRHKTDREGEGARGLMKIPDILDGRGRKGDASTLPARYFITWAPGSLPPLDADDTTNSGRRPTAEHFWSDVRQRNGAI